jgi:ATP-dependent DNA helicase RecG
MILAKSQASLPKGLEKNPGKRLPEIEKHLNLPAKTLERWIKIARTNGKIKFVGSKKTGGYFRLNQR